MDGGVSDQDDLGQGQCIFKMCVLDVGILGEGRKAQEEMERQEDKYVCLEVWKCSRQVRDLKGT